MNGVSVRDKSAVASNVRKTGICVRTLLLVIDNEMMSEQWENNCAVAACQGGANPNVIVGGCVNV